ncbi:MAG: DUF1080 domain-containing protein [Bacteroidales bacterium]|nr:DUF1080 domain-containing protein [Bacteroidales bacterium]
MKRRMYVLLTLILSISFLLETGFSRFNDPSTSANGSLQRSEIQLFNGKNLDGWYTFLKDRGRNNDPNKVFTVSKGLLRISGEEFGCITTQDEFENYRLVVEFKWGNTTYAPRVNNARDSGILLHSVGEDGGSEGIWMHSIECQVIEGGTGDFIVVGDGSENFSVTCPVAPEKQGGSYIYQPSGKTVTIQEGRINWFARDPEWKDIKGFRGFSDIENPVGKWNRIECIAKGKEILIYLNGILVNQAFDVQPQKGRIQIQSEGAEIFFRRISITPIQP